MAIQIIKELVASPNPVSLPKRIDLVQTLRSNLPAEKITIVYSMDPAHEVWFADGDHPPAKSFQRSETVGTEDKVCVDRVVLEVGQGEGPMAAVTINQAITDSIGLVVTDLVTVRIR